MKNKQVSIPTKGDIKSDPSLDVFKELEVLAAFKQKNLNQYIVEILMEHARSLRMLQYKGDIVESGYCPSCYLKGRDVKTFASPIKKAVDYGFVQVTNSTMEILENASSETFFVVCPECHWWGWPTKDELDRQDKDFDQGLYR